MKGGPAYGRGEPAPYTGSLIIGFLQEGYGPEVVNVRKKDFAGSEGEDFMGKSGRMEEGWKSKREGRGFSASLKKASIRRQLYTIYPGGYPADCPDRRFPFVEYGPAVDGLPQGFVGIRQFPGEQ